MKFSDVIYRREKARMEMLGYNVQKWVEFCKYFSDKGFIVHFHRSKTTFSKYVYVRRGRNEFKVRFSDHKPNRIAEKHSDCDFYVGSTNFGISRTEDAIKATEKFFQNA